MSTITTPDVPGAWAPDLTYIAPTDAVPDALILQTATVAGRVEGDAPSVRVQYIDDAPAGFVAEGNEIPESDPELAEVLVHTGKVSQLVRLSREQFLQPNASGQISESVRRAVTKAANIAYIQQAAPVAPAVTPPAGLLNVAGITDGGTIVDNLDGLVDLQATLAGLDAMPSHFILSPTAWAELRKLKRQSGSAESLLGLGATDATRYLLDVPVIVSNAVPAGRGLLVDKTAVIAAAGDVQVANSEHAYFTSDSVALRCTWRFGQNVVRPDRIGTFTVGTGDAS